MSRITRWILAGTLALFAGSAAGDIVVYDFFLDGLQEVPPVPTPGSGTAHVVLDTASNELSWTITFADLIGSETAAHFHGPAPVGINAGVQITLPLGSPKVGLAVLTDAQEGDVLAGMWYVNVHSTFRPGGEIRGQVVPEPATLVLLALGGLTLIRRWRRR